MALSDIVTQVYGSSRAVMGTVPARPGSVTSLGYPRPDQLSDRQRALYSIHLDVDRAVRIERPARIVRHLPDVSIRIDKRSGCAAPFGYGCRPDDRTSGSFGFLEHLGYFCNRTHIVGQLDSRSTMTTESRPQAKDHPAGLKEAHIIIGLLST